MEIPAGGCQARMKEVSLLATPLVYPTAVNRLYTSKYRL